MPVRVGVIGAGIMGADHAQTLHRWVSGAQLSAVADVDLARAEQAAAGTGAAASSDPLALIEDAEVDAVLIASHDSTHADFIRACVRAGKPVLCEKPLSPTLAESVGLVTEIGTDESLVSLGFMRRFDPGYRELRTTINEPAFRPLLAYSIGRGVTSGPGSTTESSLTNSAIHDFDLIPWLLGSPVAEVSWQGGRRSGNANGEGFDDPYLVSLHTADGVLSTVETYLNARYGYDIRCEVVGENGTASLAEPVRVITDGGLARSSAYAADWRPRFADAYRLELQAWVDLVSGSGERGDLATAHDGLVASAVADAVIASWRDGGRRTPVRVPEVSP